MNIYKGLEREEWTEVLSQEAYDEVAELLGNDWVYLKLTH